MNKERLDELREETTQYRAVADDRCMSTQYEDDILALIDAEIARQSVTDEQIRTALDYVNDYKKEAMAYDTSVGISPPTSEEVRAWETVETALRQYQKPTDEAVKRAIKWAEQERKNSFRYMDFGDADSAALAITALRQMKPDLYLQAGNDPEADDWANGYSRGYADGLQAHKKPIDDAVKDAMEWAEKELDYFVNFEHCADSAKDKVALNTILTALRQYQKPTDEAVSLCSTCIGCECEPELGETVKNCKCYIKREPTDEAVQDAISWLESDKIDRQKEWEKQDTEWKLEPGAKEMHDSFMSAFDLAITALRQMRTEQVTNVMQDSLQDERVATMLTEKQIDQTMAELHDGIRSLDIWDALWLMGVQAKQAIDLATENERLKAKLDALTAISEQDDRCYAWLKAKLDAVRKWASNPVRIDDFGRQIAQESVLAIIDKGGDDA